MANPRVTAGFRCASLLPHAIAVNTPAITATAHPVEITIHPLPSAFERFSSTAATTPSPSKIKIIVPRNSPSHGEVINRNLLHDSDRKSTRLNSSHSQISYAVFCLKKKTKTQILLCDI